MKNTMIHHLLADEQALRLDGLQSPASLAGLEAAAVHDAQCLPRQAAGSLKLFGVSKLGFPSRDRAAFDSQRQQALTLAGVLCAGQQPFSLGFHSQQGGEGAFVVGISPNLTDAYASSCLRSVFGIARMQPLASPRSLRFTSWCSGAPLPAANEPPQPVAWLDGLARAAVGRDCHVQMTFAPLDDRWLANAMSDLASQLNHLLPWQEKAHQLALSTGESSAHSDGLVPGVKRGIVGGTTQNPDSHTTSLSCDVRLFSSSTQSVCDLLRQRLEQYQCMRTGGGWSVSLSVSADDALLLEHLKSICGAALAQLGCPCSWDDSPLFTDHASPCATMLTGAQLDLLVRAPGEDFPGFQTEQLRQLELNPPRPAGPSIALGEVLSNGEPTGGMMHIPLSAFNGHCLLVGASKNGKSNTMFDILSSLDDIPFVVVEPVKGEYRALRSVYPNMKVYTLNTCGENPLRMNPFWFPEGGSVSYHISSLMAIIASAFELYEAMPVILEQCLNNVYIDCGWNLETNCNIYQGEKPAEMLFPTFTQLCAAVETYLNQSTYSAEVKGNYKSALLNRLNTFTTGAAGLLLNCRAIPPVQGWISRGDRCVLELEACASDADRAIVMGCILTQYFEALKYSGATFTRQLRRLIVLEEAHHLFQRTQSQNATNQSKEHLTTLLTNLLCEISGYDVGIAVVDQRPAVLSDAVIANTALKIVHGLTQQDDLAALNGSLLLDPSDEGAPSSLQCGEALVRYGSMRRPAHLRPPLCRCKEQAGLSHDSRLGHDGAQHLLDKLRITPEAGKVVQAKCGALVNHVLFDTVSGALAALQETCRVLRAQAARSGYTRKLMDAITPANCADVLTLYVEKALLARYPRHSLLRDRILMVVARLIDLQLGSGRSLRAGEWQLLLRAIAEDVLPEMRFCHENSERLSQLCRCIPPQSLHCADMMAGLLAALHAAVQRAPADERAARKAQLLSLPATEAVRQLGADVFALQPCEALCQTLWQGVKAAA